MPFLHFPFLLKRKQIRNIPQFKNKKTSRIGARLNHQREALTGWWWGEIAFLLLSWILLLGIIVLLRCGDHTALSNWRFPLKPNSVLAILTTFARATLLVPIISCVGQLKWLHFRRPNALHHLNLFDGTCPGPWGSLLLLFELRKLQKVAILAWAAALLSVLSLGISPTTQQALTFANELTVKNSTDVSLGVATGFATAMELDIGINSTFPSSLSYRFIYIALLPSPTPNKVR
jgi:hypothetical protein